MTFTTKRDMEDIMKRNIPTSMLSKSRSLIDVPTKASTAREKRLMIDLQTVRDAYHTFKVNDMLSFGQDIKLRVLISK